MRLNISIGRSRKETRWKIRSFEWSDLLNRLSSTHRTAETVAEYEQASKDRKSEIKDIGGFVGGEVAGGRRIRGSVVKRSLLTLDIDYGTKDSWENITMQYGNAACLYSTHSHTDEHPRYRLVMPLSREAAPEEYEALSRKIAENIGIEMFDDSTYQPERLMYWPSTPKDGVYVFRKQDGEALDVDEVLREYPSGRWQDVSQWPHSGRVEVEMRRQMTRKGEPTERPGIVGYFCRAYSISHAIETFLSDIYESNEHNRYTYTGGTSSLGLVVYDDKFAYSHHATDPACGIMCNSFDLVRIHKYGHLDKDVSADTPVNRTPSYKEMETMAEEDREVKKCKSEEVQRRCRSDFSDYLDSFRSGAQDMLEENSDWMEQLELNKGKIVSNMTNVHLIAQNAPGLKDNLFYNEFTMRIELKHNLPWRDVDASKMEHVWSNSDDINSRFFLSDTYHITGREMIADAIFTAAYTHKFHPVKIYLEKIRWDGVPRVENVLIDYLGAKDNKYIREITRKVFCAAVKRIYVPGCKFDYVLTLIGKEGIGKSTLFRVLAGDKWFSDSLPDITTKDAMQFLQGSWIIEMGELASLSKAETEATKAFISRTTDRYRPAYGRVTDEVPRQCIFVATTNSEFFLKGDGGNRRFWPVECAGSGGKVFTIDEETRAQIWAEARKYAIEDNEELYLSKECEAYMRGEQENRNISNEDVRRGTIQEYLDKKLPPQWAAMAADERIVYLADNDAIERDGAFERDRVCAAEILVECLHERLNGKTVAKSREVGRMMKNMPGWKKADSVMRFDFYGVQRAYVRIGSQYDPDV